ncbi:MAG: hypothetical protein BWY70_00872 [Bacteroidetes bacterium ADurb.Bin408]|nr:MAG: hypothetical protein BWY70_00872 [Bacteroidetes bacterium ADurb.Bin408]
MTWSIIITLILAGLFFLILEILVFPGTSVVGIVGFVLLIVAIWGAYSFHGTSYGHYTLIATFSLTFLALFFSLRSKTWKKFSLEHEVDGKVNVIDENAIKTGDTGTTVSRLAPMGNALINGEIYEVSTNGDFIDQEKEIIVIKIEKNKIIVKLKNN